MRSRVLFVLFMLLFLLLPGKYAGATTFKFTVNEIVLPDDRTTSDEEDDEDGEDSHEGFEVDHEWFVGDTFLLTISYDPIYFSSDYPIYSAATLEFSEYRPGSGFEDFNGFSRSYYSLMFNGFQALSFWKRSDIGIRELHLDSMYGQDEWSGSLRFTDHTGDDSTTIFVSGAPVPEPSTLILLGSGLVGLIVYRKKRQA